ncbi:hypothetical protein [Labilibacter marinus]|uniref:hypothetical protein n=1 Tax=Labilibacter marinus TaxID=1477105 RepID=UPI00082B8A25|nr:hypothetical protein [Labilibacter marinus]
MQKTILILLVGILLASCAQTKLTVSWKRDDSAPKEFEKIGVAVILPSEPHRLAVEEAVTEKLKTSGVNAEMTFYKFMLAGRKDILSELTFEKGELKKIAIEKIKENKYDALMVVTLLDARSERRYVQSNIGITPYFDPAYAAYNQPYYDFLENAYRAMYNYGYYETTTIVFLESNLYDTKTGNLLWTGQSETTNMESLQKEADQFSKIIVNDLIKKKVFEVK